MITNKYESPPHYETLKQQRLRQIQEDYFPPPNNNSCWPTHNPTKYIPTTFYPSEYHEFYPQDVFEVKYSIPHHIFQVIIFSSFFIFIPYRNILEMISLPVLISITPLFILALNSFIKIFNRKPRLTIHQSGIHFCKRNLYIPWENVIATHIYEDSSGEGNTYELIIDYIDTTTGECKIKKFWLHDYDKSKEAIAGAINQYNPIRLKSGAWPL